MKDRFTHRSRVGRGSIPREMRQEIYKRDEYTCQFCGKRLSENELTIDHLIPLSLGGLDEMTNYVTACSPCNGRKTNTPLAEFAGTIAIQLEELPVHGDPVIDNTKLPIQLRMIRKRIFDKARQGELQIGGTSAQKKVERTYRREFWQTEEGQLLDREVPGLPGHVRIMVPEIRTIAKNTREYLLLIELAKSANTRNLIGPILTADSDIESRVRLMVTRTKDESLRKRLQQALLRFEKEVRRRGGDSEAI